MNSLDSLREVLLCWHRPGIEKEVVMVFQVWEDGEITSQKAGDLLWQRTLHMLKPGFAGVAFDLPIKDGPHSFIWADATREQLEAWWWQLKALLIRDKLLR